MYYSLFIKNGGSLYPLNITYSTIYIVDNLNVLDKFPVRVSVKNSPVWGIVLAVGLGISNSLSIIFYNLFFFSYS